MRLRRRIVAVVAALALTGAAPPVQAHADTSRDFVTAGGGQLMLGGQPFRFAGANIEWLGLVGYGPLNFASGQVQRFPTHYEINDALATAKEMGATVIRAQTLGDTAGCANCLEPTLGTFNPQAFRVMDYVIAQARNDGLRVIPEFEGDALSEGVQQSADVFSNWEGGADFYTDPTVISDFESHIAAVVNHVNTYTGVPYKEDPTILGWMDCNHCGLTAGASTNAWVTTISSFVKHLDPNHIFISNANWVGSDPGLLDIPTVDAYSMEVYPHWAALYGLTPAEVVALPQQQAAQTSAAGKAYLLSEYGWDKTNFATQADLQTFLAGVEQDPGISGDLFWNLESHADGSGWEPLPANEECQAGAMDTSPPTAPDPTGAGCYTNEDGNWWAMYYTGIPTLINTQSDMAARAQIIRAHSYQMQGFATPPAHATPPPPSITTISSGVLYWQGSAGAGDYSIQNAGAPTGPWKTVCNQCVTDLSNGWPTTGPGTWYRVIPYNLGGVAGPASFPFNAA